MILFHFGNDGTQSTKGYEITIWESKLQNLWMPSMEPSDSIHKRNSISKAKGPHLQKSKKYKK
jgi:hypothetical protein